MRALLVALLLSSSAHAAELNEYHPATNTKDVLLADSLVCDDPKTLIVTKERVLSKFEQRDISDIIHVMKTEECTVMLDKPIDIEIRRSAVGRLIGIYGESEPEVLVEVFHNGEVLGWTESVNLKNSAPSFERLKNSTPRVHRAIMTQ